MTYYFPILSSASSKTPLWQKLARRSALVSCAAFGTIISPVGMQIAAASNCQFVPMNCYNGQDLPAHASMAQFMQNPQLHQQAYGTQGYSSQLHLPVNMGQIPQIPQIPQTPKAGLRGALSLPQTAYHPRRQMPAPQYGPQYAQPAPSPFKIRVGQPSYSKVKLPNNFQVPAHVALDQVNVQIQNDGLSVTPQLNVGVENGATIVGRNQVVRFTPFWNYGTFIRHAEVRVFEQGSSVRSRPIAILPVRNGMAQIPPFAPLPDELHYVLRVYDAQGEFDETEAKALTLADDYVPKHPVIGGDPFLTGYGIDRTAVRNIKVSGASVTVRGDNVPAGGYAHVANVGIPVDADGKFVTQMILPYGHYGFDVNVGAGGQVANFARKVYVDDTQIFYVAIGEVTLGQQNRSGPSNFLASGDDDLNGQYARGRGGMYLKGKIKGDYRITAAIDTGEERLRDIFKNLDKKDPRQLLRRLDGDQFYPVYGDESVTVEDAPTQGRFYVRVDKDDSHIMFGNFATNITGTEFAHLDRGLYGGIADFKSRSTTSFGDRKTHITGFAADPGTIPARNEFRGTGGSLYFLTRQDISIGSERLRVEIRDKVSGLVLESRDLTPQTDYEVDYIQGRILLSEPLQSTANDGQVVRTGELSGNEVYLVSRYEYTPPVGDVEGYTLGGRATQWFGDTVRLGITGQTEETDSADLEVLAGDILLRHTEGTYIKGEIATSRGPGFGQNNSTDGGFNFDTIATPGVAGQSSQAYRVEAAVDLADVSGLRGTANVYFDHQDAGFSGAGRLSAVDTQRVGGAFKAMITRFTELSVKVDDVKAKTQGKTLAVYADLTQKITHKLSATFGARHDNREVNNAGTAINPTTVGQRTDVSMQIDFRGSSKWGVYVFGQTTVQNDLGRIRNDRYGLGGQIQLTDKLDVEAEISGGNAGLGASVQTRFARTDNSEYYLGYALSPDYEVTGFQNSNRINGDNGTLTFGTRHRFSEALSVFGEERLAFGRRQTAYTHAYGVNYNPSDAWSMGASIENGRIEDVSAGDFERTAFSLSLGHTTDRIRASSSLEARFEDGIGTNTGRDRTTWLMRNALGVQAARDWEMIARYNFARSESDETSIIDAEYTEGVVGLAYRPVNHDRLNALVKYTYFENLAPSAQFSSTGTSNLASQRTQIVSADVVYDLNDKFTVGAKYGYRSGEVSFDRTNSNYIKSDAHLGVIRLDYHVIDKWDMLAEARVLSSVLAEDTQYGALLGVYRHVGDHAKIGVGYNFSRFSDDLTDFETDHEGYYLNLVSKF